MTARLINLLLSLSPRERGLLGLAVFVVLPLAVVFGLLLPLRDGHRAAVSAQSDALALQDWVLERIAEKSQLAQTPMQAVGDPIGSAGIEQSLIAVQLRRDVSALGAQADGAIELRFDKVNFLPLANWLSASHPGWGYAIDSFRFEAPDQPGKVAAALLLTPQSR